MSNLVWIPETVWAMNSTSGSDTQPRRLLGVTPLNHKTQIRNSNLGRLAVDPQFEIWKCSLPTHKFKSHFQNNFSQIQTRISNPTQIQCASNCSKLLQSRFNIRAERISFDTYMFSFLHLQDYLWKGWERQWHLFLLHVVINSRYISF